MNVLDKYQNESILFRVIFRIYGLLICFNSLFIFIQVNLDLIRDNTKKIKAIF